MKSSTEYNVEKHINIVRQNLYIIIRELLKRLAEHDSSKLREPKLSLWKQMDSEPSYPYGSFEYLKKQKRYKKAFDLHYQANRHHPEHFRNGIASMNLIDILEMLTDWISYSDVLSITDAVDLVNTQAKRFGFGDETINYIMNTLLDYFATIWGLDDEKKSKPLDPTVYKRLVDITV